MPSPAGDEYRIVPCRWFKAPVEQAVSFRFGTQANSALQHPVMLSTRLFHTYIDKNINWNSHQVNSHNADKVGRMKTTQILKHTILCENSE